MKKHSIIQNMKEYVHHFESKRFDEPKTNSNSMKLIVAWTFCPCTGTHKLTHTHT